MIKKTQSIMKLVDYNNSRLNSLDILTGKEFRRLKRRNKI